MATDPEFKPLISFSSPGSLQGIVASKIAFLCWRHEINNLYSDEDIEVYQVSINDHTLPLPRHMIDLINILIKPLCFKFMKWWHFHGILHFHLDDLPSATASLRTECLNRIICKSNTNYVEICYIKTAENLLISDKLSLIQKYRLACMYRFNSYVEKLWPSVLNPEEELHPEFVIDTPFANTKCSDDIFILKYWTYPRDNPSSYNIEPVKLSRSNNPANYRQFVTTVLRNNNMHPQVKVDYFCNIVGLQSQYAIEDIICNLQFRNPVLRRYDYYSTEFGRHKLERYELIKYLLPKLKIDHLKRVLEKLSIQFITYLAHEEENYLYILQIWSYMKDLVTEQKFFDLLYELWRMTFASHCCVYNRHVASLLCDIFWTASNNLKNYIVEHHVGRFFYDLPAYNEGRNMTKYGFNVDFFLQLLKNTNFELRRKLWCDNWYKLIFLMDAENLDKLMNLCYNSRDEIVQCKEVIQQNCSMFMPGIYDLFVENGLYSDLISFLKCIIPSDDEIMEEMKRIVNWNLDKMTMMNLNALIRFNELIDGTFKSADSAKQCKEDYIMQNVESWCDWLNSGELNRVKNVVDCCISSESCKIQLKKIFYEYYQNILRSGNFTEFSIRECEEFLHWCAPNQIEFCSFKESLDVVEIFQKFVDKVKMENCRRLNRYNDGMYKHFLQWYFVYDDFRKDFVDVMLNNIQEDDHFKSVLKGYFY